MKPIDIKDLKVGYLVIEVDSGNISIITKISNNQLSLKPYPSLKNTYRVSKLSITDSTFQLIATNVPFSSKHFKKTKEKMQVFLKSYPELSV